MRALAALVLATGVTVGTGALSAPADTTLTVSPEAVASGSSVTASGTCSDGAGPYAVTVTVYSMTGDELTSATTNAAPDGSYSVAVTPSSSEPLDFAVVEAVCMAYDGTEGVATAELLIGSDFTFDEATISVTPASAPLGSSVTVTAQCGPGSTTALIVLATDDGVIFQVKDVNLEADGSISTSIPLVQGSSPDIDLDSPAVGSAGAGILCFNEAGDDLLAYGTAEFTITAAAATPTPTRSDSPTLAETGSSNPLPLVGVAVMLLLVGSALTVVPALTRRRSSEPRRH